MEAQIWVFIPWLSKPFPFPNDISSVGHLRRAIWTEEISPLDQKLSLSHCLLRSLLVPVPMEPQDTLQNRVFQGSRGNGSAETRDTDAVPPGWSNQENIHVYLIVDLGLKTAEKLYEKLWGEDLNAILEEISDDDGTWKYVPKTRIDDLKMSELGYNETRGLLVRPEYDVAFGMLQQAHDHWTPEDCGGVVVTGQPGIGKTCFLYYLLFRRLSERRPVALEQPKFFILFHEGGVYRYSLNADTRYLPDGTWALSDSNDEAPKPCTTFRSASKLRTAWIVQTTSPVETRWRDWRKYCKAGMFVMNHVSIEDITALSKVFNLDVSDVSNIQRLYRKWGPSARTCLDLLQFGAEAEHEHSVDVAACRFVQDPPKIVNFDFDESKVSHRLFSIRPKGQDRTGRRMQIAEIATDHIKEIISYAAANANADKSSFSRSWLHGISI
ncbi:hypothetical protein EDB84DRAFT_1570276 [Lactarius hengduanensis]|nr:hypothetical protein EDB84DRAFT_1570276 [Lactarius hengduanensis]